MPVDLKIGAEPTKRNPASRDVAAAHQADDEAALAPAAPGAVHSPQMPGQVPDRSTIPGQHAVRVPRADQVRRPLTEYGTAQAIMRVYAAAPGEEMNPARFEQATASYEELRKAYPAQLPPQRPGPGYALDTGDTIASEMQAVDGPIPTAAAPATAIGEPWSARPGGGTEEIAVPAKADAPAAEVGSGFSPSDAPASVRSPSDAATGPSQATGEGAGQSRWAEASPAPGDATSTGGTLPPAKDGETNVKANPGSPQEAPQ